ncbi:hypothetical protein GAGA_2894 [Paraglaciecola agarilytica NO2]|uniref:Uncharacterized protein n=1 Tax=Paraglaciecola agarilytica NO2 TaxID=1125747 RepID=A0ABQ0I8Q7_9ALTE|nr:hypothetical protein GAGA_2894 [Paraglaciecola agarilytica NO2]
MLFNIHLYSPHRLVSADHYHNAIVFLATQFKTDFVSILAL